MNKLVPFMLLLVVSLVLAVPIKKEPRKFVYQDNMRSVKRYHVFPDRIPDMSGFHVKQFSSVHNALEDTLNLGEDPVKKKEQSMKEEVEEEALKVAGQPEETTELFPDMDFDVGSFSSFGGHQHSGMEGQENKMKEKEMMENEMKEKEMMEKEIMEKEMMEKEMMEKEMMEKEMKEKEMMEKEMMEKEMKEKEMMEKEMMEKEMKEEEMTEEEMMEKEVMEEEDIMTTTIIPGEEEMTVMDKEITMPEKEMTSPVELEITPGGLPMFTSSGEMRVMTVARTEMTVTEGEGEMTRPKEEEEEEEEEESYTTEVADMATEMPSADEIMAEEAAAAAAGMTTMEKDVEDPMATIVSDEDPVTEAVWGVETSTQEAPVNGFAPEEAAVSVAAAVAAAAATGATETEVEVTTFSSLDQFL